jgi:16S rRNA (cytosine967-C5)-methyltransferase
MRLAPLLALSGDTPDIPLLRRDSDVGALAQTQQRMLDALWPLLSPKGRMLYCTCSVLHEEGQGQIDSFLKRNTQAVLRPSPGHLIPGGTGNGASLLDNAHSGYDGFFMQCLSGA